MTLIMEDHEHEAPAKRGINYDEKDHRRLGADVVSLIGCGDLVFGEEIDPICLMIGAISNLKLNCHRTQG
jgi:hypothetical protein